MWDMMHKCRHIFIGLGVLAFAGLTATPAFAADRKFKRSAAPFSQIGPNHAPNSQPVFQLAQNKVSASQAKAIARSQVPGGEVVDVSQKGNTYRVRVIAKDGRVVDVLIDASTGRVKR